MTKEQVIVFNDSELDKLYGKINDSIASYKKNPQKVKEYYEKRKKQKRIKIGISAFGGIVLAIVLITLFLQPQFYIEDKYAFGKSWGNLSLNNLEFSSPEGVAIDSKDNLYVADTLNNRIQKIQPDGNVIIIENYGSSLYEFNNPSGLAVDSKDNLYVADTFNNRIQVFDNFEKFVKVIGNNGSALGEFYYPSGIAIDSKDNLYVADSGNNRIQKI